MLIDGENHKWNVSAGAQLIRRPGEGLADEFVVVAIRHFYAGGLVGFSQSRDVTNKHQPAEAFNPLPRQPFPLSAFQKSVTRQPSSIRDIPAAVPQILPECLWPAARYSASSHLMTDQLETARRSYAEELRFTAHLRSPAVVAAFATVPRERFLGAGPWRVRSPMDAGGYWTTEDADPRAVYHDVLIALDEARGINNGQPILWAFLLDQLDIAAGAQVLHLGCGTGYYTSIMAELIGPKGKITAIEIDAGLAGKAHAALMPWPQITVSNANGASMPFEPADLIVASAGATHPLPAWLDALKLGGRLLFPMTATQGPGGMLLVTREAEDGFAARFLCRVGFIDFSGARDADISRRLAAALARDRERAVQSLRRDHHAKGRTCWLHGEGWCLSRRLPAVTRSATP
jgi:protein-L-isoaspartate(D-aspartate) O-methyltransferase